MHFLRLLIFIMLVSNCKPVVNRSHQDGALVNPKSEDDLMFVVEKPQLDDVLLCLMSDGSTLTLQMQSILKDGQSGAASIEMEHYGLIHVAYQKKIAMGPGQIKAEFHHTLDGIATGEPFQLIYEGETYSSTEIRIAHRSNEQQQCFGDESME